ncbi:HPr kinase/phosphorylase [Pseudovibrio brasiliensis]|uniref:HPr kinase/phosphatase C-terminal domain-containing protein n=1 Tax=Pseudovibrio brasiliensis TaxID=1898042 RepID=A0ABX8ASE9_9HYPH|nr:HPr kinase/phosphatase C-terminal domain-containing protein [Pseudovibrio brasiliensis]QUS56111.1 HPr kinase/phosphatase C-terminal domain-containing protein [Pseudovibrio brasiliensis]
MTTLDQKQSVQAAEGQAIHATCLVVGTKGILIRGPSATGKSALALELIQRAHLKGSFAALVADDRVYIAEKNGRLIGSCPNSIKGKAELRGFGIVEVPYLDTAIIHMVLDLEAREEIDRLPEEQALTCELCSVKLIRQQVPKEDHLAALRLANALIFTNPVHNY